MIILAGYLHPISFLKCPLKFIRLFYHLNFRCWSTTTQIITHYNITSHFTTALVTAPTWDELCDDPGHDVSRCVTMCHECVLSCSSADEVLPLVAGYRLFLALAVTPPPRLHQTRPPPCRQHGRGEAAGCRLEINILKIGTLALFRPAS